MVCDACYGRLSHSTIAADDHQLHIDLPIKLVCAINNSHTEMVWRREVECVGVFTVGIEHSTPHQRSLDELTLVLLHLFPVCFFGRTRLE